jgi:hypothetical protein
MELRGGNSVGRVPASQAGCRGFESRPPLPEKPITTRKTARTDRYCRSSFVKCARIVPEISDIAHLSKFMEPSAFSPDRIEFGPPVNINLNDLGNLMEQ